MALVDLLAPWLPVGGLALVCLLAAWHGWEIIGWLRALGQAAKISVAMIALLGLGIALGVIEGFDFNRLVELIMLAVSFVADLLPI